MLRRNPAMVFTELDDSLVMMNPERGSYHELDPIAARIWALLESDRSVADLRDALLLEYDDVAPEQCERDLLAFLDQALAPPPGRVRRGAVRRAVTRPARRALSRETARLRRGSRAAP